MVAPSQPSERRWFERTVIAAMVVAGFAIGSLGLTVAAELLGEQPVLTDEFNAPVAEDDPSGIVAVAATTTTQPPPTSTEVPTTTVPEDEERRGDDGRRRDGDDRRDRVDDDEGRDPRRRA